MRGTKLKDILQIPIFAKAKVLSGKSELSKHVTTVSVAEVPDILSWVRKGALYLTTLYAFRTEDAQIDLIRGLWEKGAAGLVIKPKRFLDSIPAKMIKKADSLGFPLIEISPEVVWSDIIPGVFEKILEEEATYKAKGGFLEALIAGNYSTEEEITRRGEFVGCNLKDPHVVLTIDIDNFSYYLVNEKPAEDDVLMLKENLSSLIQEKLEKALVRNYVLPKNDSFIVLALTDGIEHMIQLSQHICDQVRDRVRPLTVSIGLGELAIGTEEIKRSFSEAVRALRIANILQGGNSVSRFKDVEDYILLANLADAPELDSFLQSTLGKLIDYDIRHQTAFLETMRTYFLCGESKARTARALFIHLNTLKYRLHKIEEILDFKFSDADASFRLKLAARLLRFKRHLDRQP